MVLNYWQIIGLIFLGAYFVMISYELLLFIKVYNEGKQEGFKEKINEINKEKDGSDNLWWLVFGELSVLFS